MDYERLSDSELVKEMFPKQGRSAWELEAAWREFINRFEKILIKAIHFTFRRYAPYVRLSQEDVRDLVQQIFLKLSENDYKALRDLRCYQESSVRLYLYAIATNAALGYFRSAKTARRSSITQSLSDDGYEFEEESMRLYPGITDQERNYMNKELLERILEVVDSESEENTRERNRNIFIMAHLDGYTRSEIAAQENMSLKRPGINSFLLRIKRKLEDLYKTVEDRDEVRRY